MVDEVLVGRVRELVGARVPVEERRMFGGVAFLVGGHMAVGVSGKQGGLMVRVPPEETPSLLAEPGTRPFEMRGRGLAGWLLVEPGAVADDDELDRWVDAGVAHARSLPPKE
ncbi:TfoX/Sxy family protein [Cellulomonas fimi]|uniref:TfoX N-terminal domain-containing protein n=1 Tax=Cellulomonas fimi (strain ATCC 484 / DSM 20113 / JCM 1341 / CCUG 24087 / LMG 16345 / NBRC 15513 / NCIMB 8980 / NCTC 7547 / NRS-133) TaxID=590998 RepID=F4H7X7_CELFA|nr:TfoX/Sxy family protein [Cellulomonas fimi]AEE46938.1 hypothetical protein Celf_2814 [Cellulomonas fimi ATCC 484]NNH07885.1 TfoX/Sxy family protein [Cellulomonas fimi]VEH34621.1 Regulator of competence-specific genes [Cellulomonas fimi]